MINAIYKHLETINWLVNSNMGGLKKKYWGKILPNEICDRIYFNINLRASKNIIYGVWNLYILVTTRKLELETFI